MRFPGEQRSTVIQWPSNYPMTATMAKHLTSVTARELSTDIYERYSARWFPRPLRGAYSTILVRSTMSWQSVILVAHILRCTDRSSSAAWSTKGATFPASTAHNATRATAFQPIPERKSETVFRGFAKSS